MVVFELYKLWDMSLWDYGHPAPSFSSFIPCSW